MPEKKYLGVDVRANGKRIRLRRSMPFVWLHVGCLGVFWVGISPVAVAVAAGMYLLRMFAITGFYHRYFSHRAFKTSRPVQFLFAVIGCTAMQHGPLWWASHHRHHHRHSDTPDDSHTPRHGFYWSHAGWFACEENYRGDHRLVPDFAVFPELRFIDRFDSLVPAVFALLLYWFGAWLEDIHPDMGTSGLQVLVWGFFISTALLAHATFSISSIAHRYGTQRYETGDDSRNNWFLAIVTLGEGWHNNHHHRPRSARQGVVWWEIDITYYVLKLLSVFRIVWDLKVAPAPAAADRVQ